MANPVYVRTLGYLPADAWTHYVLCDDGNVWIVDSRSERRSIAGAMVDFDPTRYRIVLDPKGARG